MRSYKEILAEKNSEHGHVVDPTRRWQLTELAAERDYQSQWAEIYPLDPPVKRIYTTDEAVDELGIRAEYEEVKRQGGLT